MDLKTMMLMMMRYAYGGSGIVDTVGSLLARYATKAMLVTAANALCVGVDAAKRAVPHLQAHQLATTIARKLKRLEKAVPGSQEPHSKQASADTGGIDRNANDWGIYITTSRRQCCR